MLDTCHHSVLTNKMTWKDENYIYSDAIRIVYILRLIYLINYYYKIKLHNWSMSFVKAYLVMTTIKTFMLLVPLVLKIVYTVLLLNYV